MIALFSETSYLVAKMIVMMTILPQMLPISSQSLNGANSAARRAAEWFKKGQLSEFNPRDYEQVKSSPPLKVWSDESVKDTVTFEKRVKLRVS